MEYLMAPLFEKLSIGKLRMDLVFVLDLLHQTLAVPRQLAFGSLKSLFGLTKFFSLM